MAQGRRARLELRRGPGESRADAKIREAWDAYVAAGKALAAIRPCESTCPDFAQDVAPTVCQKLEGHLPGEADGGHRHRILGSQVVLTW